MVVYFLDVHDVSIAYNFVCLKLKLVTFFLCYSYIRVYVVFVFSLTITNNL